jgi:hypothetical protein
VGSHQRGISTGDVNQGKNLALVIDFGVETHECMDNSLSIYS